MEECVWKVEGGCGRSGVEGGRSVRGVRRERMSEKV